MLIAKVVITDLDSVDHTITPSGMGDADVLDVAFTHKAADDFVITIGDKTDTIKDWLKRGCTAKIYIDTDPVPSTLKLHGMVEDVTSIQPVPDFILFTASGRETFHVIINNRIVTETYLDTEVSVIVQDLMDKYAPEIDEITHVDVTTTTLDDIRFPYRPLKECLEELARLSGFTYYCGADLKLHWVEEQTEDSGFTYTEANIEVTPEVIESLLPIKNRVYVIGGNYMQVDQEQTTTAATKNTKDFWYAQSFIPERSDLDQVSLHLKRTGDPANLEGEIRTDDPGNGPDEIVANFTIDKDFVGLASSWRPVSVEATLLIGVKYWIVLQKIGDGANNYEWSDDNHNAGENAFDADGVGAWTVQAASYQMAFKTHYTIPILSVASDFAHSAIYKWRETVIEDKGIMSRTLARETAKAKLADLKDMTAQIRDIAVGDVTGIPALGKLVTITLAKLGISAVQYVAKEAKIKFKGGEAGAFSINLRLGREASELAEWLRDLKAEVDRTKVGAFGVEKWLINLVRNLSDTAEATDANLVGTVQLTGTFLIDVARIDFSDIA